MATESALQLTKQEAWEAFEAWHASSRSRFAFHPSRSEWRKRARKMGIPLKEFEAWADRFNWWVNASGKQT